MSSYAPKGTNPILMISYNLYLYSYLKLYYDVINVMFLSDYVTYQFVLCSVVSKHLLLVLRVLFLL